MRMSHPIRTILLLLLPPVLLFGLVLLGLWMPLPSPLPPALSHGRNLLVAVLTGIAGLIYVVSIGVFIVRLFKNTAKFLDAVLIPAGFQAKAYLWIGSQYSGTYNGNSIRVHYISNQGFRPAILNIRIKTQMDMRLAIGLERPILDCTDCPRIHLHDVHDETFHIYGDQDSQTVQYLQSPGMAEHINFLLADQRHLGLRELYIQPDQIWLRSHPVNVSSEIFKSWLDRMLLLSKN